MHHDDYYFNTYLEDGYCFLYCVSTDTNIKMPLCKLAVTIEMSDCYVEKVYDSLDNICNDSNINKSIYAFVKDNEETIKNYIKKLRDSDTWEDDDSDFNPNSEYVINPLRYYLNFTLRQSQYEDVNAFLSYSEDPVNLFLFRYENKYIGMTNRDVIAEGKQFIDEYIDLVQLARLSGTKYDMLNKLFGSNGYKTENNCFIIKDFLTTKTYCTCSSKQSYLLLDFLSCIVNKINGSYEFFFDENSRQSITDLINKLFDTKGLLEDLSNCIKSYNKESELFRNNITKKNPRIGVSTFKVDETRYNFTNLVDLMLNIARDFDNEAYKHSDILQMYSSIIDKESLLNSFFAKIALILLNHVRLNESTADTWFDVICSKDGYENSYTTMEESSPTVKLIVQYNNYYFNRSKLDTIYNVSTIGNYA